MIKGIKNGKIVYITMIEDCNENKGGFYCQVYQDETLKNEIDDFCIHNDEYVDDVIFDYLDKNYFRSGIEVLMPNGNIIEVDCHCYNGIAIGKEFGTENWFTFYYPKLEDVLKDDDMIEEILTYCGLYDLNAKHINYGDIMVTYGEILFQ